MSRISTIFTYTYSWIFMDLIADSSKYLTPLRELIMTILGIVSLYVIIRNEVAKKKSRKIEPEIEDDGAE